MARKLGDEDIHVHEIKHFEGKAVSLINGEYFNKIINVFVVRIRLHKNILRYTMLSHETKKV